MKFGYFIKEMSTDADAVLRALVKAGATHIDFDVAPVHPAKVPPGLLRILKNVTTSDILIVPHLKPILGRRASFDAILAHLQRVHAHLHVLDAGIDTGRRDPVGTLSAIEAVALALRSHRVRKGKLDEAYVRPAGRVSRFNEKDLADIHHLVREKGHSMTVIARDYRVSLSTIHRVVHKYDAILAEREKCF